jgi:DNA invertase Pin-like site-specific DNA recombinase
MPPRRPSTSPALAVAYLRVSTDEQALGPEAQRAAIVRWAASAGVEVVAWHEDLGVSGGAPLDRRPGLLAALAGLGEHGAGLLVVAKRDRLTRGDVLAGAMIEQLAGRVGARIVSAAGEGTDGEHADPAAQLMRRMVDAFAEYERALIGQRTRAALNVKRGRGERIGELPLGRMVGADGVTLIENPAEARAVELVHELRAEGLSIRAIADELNRRGVPARGERWHAKTVHRLVRVAS